MKKIIFKNKFYKVNKPITLTPYGSNKPCSANCLFCSEKLVLKNCYQVNKIEFKENYFKIFNSILKRLGSLKFGISLSGLEYSENIEFMKRILKIIRSNEKKGLKISSKVLYSNGSGFYKKDSNDLNFFIENNIDRIELSRHHFDEEINDSLMRFKNKNGIKKQINFKKTVQKLINLVNVKLVCLLQKNGINSHKNLIKYLEFAKKLKIKEVVFRELCKTGNGFEKNKVFIYIKNNRIKIKDLIPNLDNDFDYIKSNKGYYYQSFSYLWKNEILVTFEKSNYKKMKIKHSSNTIYKLIFWGNGNLTSDWEPNKNILIKSNE